MGHPEFAKSRESNRAMMDFSDCERIFGSLLGSVPTIRTKTNAVVIWELRRGRFGGLTWPRSTYSVANMLSTVRASPCAMEDRRSR